MEATAKDLRFHSKQLLDTVRRGEEVLITYRGKPCARLVPVSQDAPVSEGDEVELFGIWSDHPAVESVEEYVDRIRERR